MSAFFLMLAAISMLGVVFTLIYGMKAFLKQENSARLQSNRLMRLRIALQGMAVLFLLLSWLL